MSSKPPFIGQEKSDTCMFACLRMLLAQRGKDVPEATLAEQAVQEQGGIRSRSTRCISSAFTESMRRLVKLTWIG